MTVLTEDYEAFSAIDSSERTIFETGSIMSCLTSITVKFYIQCKFLNNDQMNKFKISVIVCDCLRECNLRNPSLIIERKKDK